MDVSQPMSSSDCSLLTSKERDQGGVDDPKQSACGIPHNAYYTSHVAIHPYWLKYAPLDRESLGPAQSMQVLMANKGYCRPDMCISFWTEDWKTDMMLKVTDICSTDPSKPNSCQQPGDIKIDRTKVKIWSGSGGDSRPAEQIPGLDGDAFKDPTIWFFRSCWDDGMIQPPYDHDGNHFAMPKFYNNLDQTGDFASDQMRINQVMYPENMRYANCAYNTSCQGDAIQSYPDWTANSAEPDWSPICGGQGFSGKPASSSSNCPTTSGEGATADLSGQQKEIDACKAMAEQVEQTRDGEGTFAGMAGASGGNGTTAVGGAAGGTNGTGGTATNGTSSTTTIGGTSNSNGTDYIGSDVCGNGGCTSLQDYCSHVLANGATDPKCSGLPASSQPAGGQNAAATGLPASGGGGSTGGGSTGDVTAGGGGSGSGGDASTGTGSGSGLGSGSGTSSSLPSTSSSSSSPSGSNFDSDSSTGTGSGTNTSTGIEASTNSGSGSSSSSSALNGSDSSYNPSTNAASGNTTLPTTTTDNTPSNADTSQAARESAQHAADYAAQQAREAQQHAADLAAQQLRESAEHAAAGGGGSGSGGSGDGTASTTGSGAAQNGIDGIGATGSGAAQNGTDGIGASGACTAGTTAVQNVTDIVSVGASSQNSTSSPSSTPTPAPAPSCNSNSTATSTTSSTSNPTTTTAGSPLGIAAAAARLPRPAQGAGKGVGNGKGKVDCSGGYEAMVASGDAGACYAGEFR
ncbi:uncharacterized protein KY384_001254 [Bacidia gigantensis]|uniref:uncharacterized protein n=1 Tax=Bacidia gigantensis TaxID=2732470 RepID=UPI001D05338D|nr:uncharacterized protein KY384_001254 [Bacidia gigantensis]KAG8534409.1 hypothetical protein KY384_001254 [Bacidia gigantensis]